MFVLQILDNLEKSRIRVGYRVDGPREAKTNSQQLSVACNVGSGWRLANDMKVRQVFVGDMMKALT